MSCTHCTHRFVRYRTEEGHKPLGIQSDNWFCFLDPTARPQSCLEWSGCPSDRSPPRSQRSLRRCPGCPTSSPLHAPPASQPACWHRAPRPSICAATPTTLPWDGSRRRAVSSATHSLSAACSAHLMRQHAIKRRHSNNFHSEMSGCHFSSYPWYTTQAQLAGLAGFPDSNEKNSNPNLKCLSHSAQNTMVRHFVQRDITEEHPDYLLFSLNLYYSPAGVLKMTTAFSKITGSPFCS